MNKELQEEQMDAQIRYCNEISKLIDTRFFDSQLLRRPNAKDFFDFLITSLKDLHSKHLLWLYMDGPNTNWSGLRMLHDDCCEKDYPKIIDIDSCSLHVLHWIFKSSVEATDMFLNKILKAMWKIFNDFPIRRNTYIKIYDVDKFPLSYWFYIVSKHYL